MADTNLNFIHSTGDLICCELPKNTSDSDFAKWKREQKKYLQLNDEILHEDVQKYIASSDMRAFAKVFEAFRAVSSQPAELLDFNDYTTKLVSYMQMKHPENFTTRFNSQVTTVQINGSKKVNQIKTVDQSGVESVIECDRLVLCEGYKGAESLQKYFGLTIPIIPVRGYSFDIVPTNPNKKLPALKDSVKFLI